MLVRGCNITSKLQTEYQFEDRIPESQKLNRNQEQLTCSVLKTGLEFIYTYVAANWMGYSLNTARNGEASLKSSREAK